MAENQKKHHRFKTFNDRIDEVDVSIWRNIEFVRTGEDGAPAGDIEDPEKPHFTELLQHWTQTNRTQDFADCAKELRPLVQSLPMIIFNLEAVVGALLQHAAKPKSMAAEPVLMLLGALGRDVRGELTPYFGKIFSTLASLLEVATRVGGQDAELIELVFQSLAYILKYLARYVANDLPKYLSTYAVLLSHQKPYIRHFAGETLAFIIRRLRAGRIDAAVGHIFGLLSMDRTQEELIALADSLSVMLFEATKSIQHQFHSQMQGLLEAVLHLQVRADAGDAKSPARAVQLWTVKAALLRMRNHAHSLEGSADLLEVMFTHFRDAVQHYCDAVSGTRASVAEDAQIQDDSSPVACEQEILFYIDLLVSWVWVKPRPRVTEESDWTVFVDVALGGLTTVLVATRKHENAKTAELQVAQEDQEAALRFPPVPLSVAEAAARALLLLWRALPTLVRARCDPEMTRLLAEMPETVSTQLERPAMHAAGPCRERSLSLLAAAMLPEPLAGLERTPLMQPLLATSVETLAPGVVKDAKLSTAATLLCGSLLQHAGQQCLSQSVEVLASATSQGALFSNLLSSIEATVAEPSLEQGQLEQIAAASECALQLCRTCRSLSSPGPSFVTCETAQRCALLVFRFQNIPEGLSLSEFGLIRGRLLSSTALVLSLGDCLKSHPPEGSWPESGGARCVSEDGVKNWLAWFLAWVSMPPLQAPVMHAVHDSLKLLMAHSHTGQPIPSYLEGVRLGTTMVQCRQAAGSSDRWIRHGALQLSSILPEQLLLRPLQRLGDPSQASTRCDESDWQCTIGEQDSVDQAMSKQLAQLLDLCKRLEDLDVDFQTERTRAELMRKISRAVRRLPVGCWASTVAVQLLLGQLSVKLATAWEPALEALLHVASDANRADDMGPKKRGKPRGKKKRKQGDDDAPDMDTSTAPQAQEEELHAVESHDPKETAKDDDAGGDKDALKSDDRGVEAVAISKSGKKRRRVSLTGIALDSMWPGQAWSDDGGAFCTGLEELSLEPWLNPQPVVDESPPHSTSSAWWWTEAIWASGVELLLKHEAPVAAREADTEQNTEEGDDNLDAQSLREKSSAKPVKYTKLKRKSTHQMLSVESPLDAAKAMLWQSGVQGWRTALGIIWQELSQWECLSTYGITMHELAWKLITRLLEQNFWHARSASLTAAQASLGKCHTEWMLAKFLQLLCNRYGQGKAGWTGSKPSLMHALQSVAVIPSIEICPRPLVQLCAHGCLHWLLLEQDTKLQQLALTVMSRCKRIFPHVSACEESLRRLCDDSTFHHELLSLSVSVDGDVAEAVNEEEGLRRALYQHRDALMPIVLRILFSKATKRGQALDKHSSQQSRRSSIFSYLSALTEQAGLPEMLLVLLESLLVVLASPSGDGASTGWNDPSRLGLISSSIRRAGVLRHIFAERALGSATTNISCSEWLTSPLSSFSCLQATLATGSMHDAPSGWAWSTNNTPSAAVQPQLLAILNPAAKNAQWLGLLHTMGDMIPQMADKLEPHAVFLMEVLASLMERVGANARDQARAEQAPMVRQVMRLAVLRAKDLFERYVALVEKLVLALRPAAGTLEFLFGRLASTSGSVQVSAVVLLAQSWVKEPALFCCFQELCPNALPSLFRIPAGPSVRAMIAAGERQTGPVVPIVVEVALRLSRGGVLDVKGLKKARQNYLDIKRERRRRKKVEGDESGDSVSADSDEDEAGGRQAAWGLSKAEQEENTKRGVALLRPHVNVLLSSFHVLIQHRLQYRSQAKPAASQQSQRGRRGSKSSERRLPPVATTNEMSLMASVAEWCTDVGVAQQLVGLLVTALTDLVRDRRAPADQMLLMVASLRRLVFIALPVPCAQIEPVASTETAGQHQESQAHADVDKGRSGTGPRSTAASRTQAEKVAHSLVRLLGVARDVALRAQLGELLVEVEAIRAFKEQARAYCDQVADIEMKVRWQPNMNKCLGDMLAKVSDRGDSLTNTKASDFCAVHVAHVVAALNTLRRSGLREPDVDMHVEVLQVLGDSYLLPSEACRQSGGNPDVLALESSSSSKAHAPAQIVPAVLLQPIISHTLFIISVEGVDIGVQHGMERLLCVLADRLVLAVAASPEAAPAAAGHTDDASELLHLLLTSIVPGLRKMLRAPHEDVYRTALRVLGHFARHLAPHSAALRAWGASARGDAVGDTASVFGSSPDALLHADLLPLLRGRDAKGDEGGDLFGNLLHLQKHRRGRGLVALSAAAAEGTLTSNTLSHIVVPVCLQAVLQRSSSTAAFDINYAEVAVKCLGECMRRVAWSTCLQTVRFLSTLLTKQDSREKWIIRASCECLACFPFPENPLPSPESFMATTVSQEDSSRTVDVQAFDHVPTFEPQQGSGKGKLGKGRKKKGKGKGKGKGKKGLSQGETRSEEIAADGEGKDTEKDSKTEVIQGSAVAEEIAEASEEPNNDVADIDAGDSKVEAMARNLRTTVLPILKRMVWQKDRSSVASAPDDRTGSKGSGKGPRSGTGLVRIPVIGVMMHCVKHLPESGFRAELPRILGLVIDGLADRDVDHRRAARQAAQRVISSLGKTWLGWLLGELRMRLNRGFMVPVCAATALSCVQVLHEETSLSPGDLDGAFKEIMEQIERELLRLLDPVRPEAELEEAEKRPGLAPEAKKPKGPELLLLAAQFSSPQLVLDALWALDRRLQGIVPEQATSKKGPALAPLPSQSLAHLRRVEELLTKAVAGLGLNAEFTVPLQVNFIQELLGTVATLLNVGRFGAAGTTSEPTPVAEKDNQGAMAVAKVREAAFAVQPGAASGRSSSAGSAGQSKGVDVHARAGVLGVLGLRMLQQSLKKRVLPMPAASKASSSGSAGPGPTSEDSTIAKSNDDRLAMRIEVDIVPAVVTCFCSRQDRLFVASAKCLQLLRGFYSARPEVVGAHGARIAKTVLKTFEIVAGAPQLSQHLRTKARARGLTDVGAAAVLATSTQLLSALLGNAQSVEWFKPLGAETVTLSTLSAPVPVEEEKKSAAAPTSRRKEKKAPAADALVRSNFFDALVTQIRTALDQPALQPSALQLLRRVLLRNRVLTAAVYQCIDAVGELLITAQEKRLAQQCAQIYVDFMLDYPHEERALQQRLMQLLKNLGYAEETGRHAVLNCLYLVVLHFPEAELSSKWSGMIFVSVAARLPQESDPTTHQMLHVVIKSLLEQVDSNQHKKLLDLALSWRRSPKRVLHAALAECLGLFAESAGSRSAQWMSAALPALAGVLQSADHIDTSMTAAAEPTGAAPPWRAVYAVSKAFERILGAVSADALDQLLVSGAAPNPGDQAHKLQTVSEPNDQEASSTELVPGAALAYLWQHLFGGQDPFTQEELHPWVLAVSLRALEGQLARCMPPPDQQGKVQVAQRAALWFGSSAPAPTTTNAKKTVSASGLLRALEALCAAERLERDSSVAPLCVRALCALTNLLLKCPELMPEVSGEDGALAAANEEEEEEEDREDGATATEDAGEKVPPKGPEEAPAEARKRKRPSKRKSAGASSNDQEAGGPVDPSQQGLAVSAESQITQDKSREDAQGDPEAKAEAADPDQQDDAEEEEEVAVDELEGSRQMGPSLFETVAGNTDAQLITQEVLPAAKLGSTVEGDHTSAGAILQRSRIRWLVVRLSHRARAFLSQPSVNFVRLISILRYFTALTEALPLALLLHLLEPLLTPTYRCISAFSVGANSSLPDVQTLEQALQLNTSLRLEFLAQLAQACMDSLTSKMQEAGHGSQLMQALAKVRRAVERHRAERSQKKRLQRVTDPQAAAQQKRAKNRRKQASKKRKLEEVIMATKGGRGVVGSSKKNRTLA